MLIVTAKLVTKASTSHRQVTTSSRQLIENQHFRVEKKIFLKREDESSFY